MKLKLAAALAAAVMGLAGCANMSPGERQTAATIGGAAGGALVGGELIGGPLGTLGGAAAGGYLGHRATDPYRR